VPVLKRKADRTTTISLRIPVSLKGEIDHLRPLADANGFDVNVSLVDAISRCAKQMAEELSGLPKSADPHNVNGSSNSR
jgi:hypothetical protein